MQAFKAFIKPSEAPQNQVDNDDKYMHENIPELLVFFCLIFSHNKMLLFGLSFISYVTIVRKKRLLQQLPVQDNYFFRTAALILFFRTVAFSQELFFQNSFFFGVKLVQSRHFLRIRSSLWQLLFETAILSGGTVQDKDI